MSVREREGLIARIRQIRRAAAEDEQTSRPMMPEQDELASLAARVAHLEQLVEGFQDSVHRESERQANRIAELEARTQPSVLGKALSDDARSRGL
jgi:hypothetical protein